MIKLTPLIFQPYHICLKHKLDIFNNLIAKYVISKENNTKRKYFRLKISNSLSSFYSQPGDTKLCHISIICLMVTVLKWRAQLERLFYRAIQQQKIILVKQIAFNTSLNQCAHPNAVQFITLTFEITINKME